MKPMKYLGSFPVEINNSPYKDYTAKDWVLKIIYKYGQIDGSHHKQWVIDQVVRVLNNCPIEVEVRKWDNGYKEYDFIVGDSEEYNTWVKRYKTSGDDNDAYAYDEGIAP